MLSKSSKAYISISKARLSLIEGVIVCVDPSIGSNSSLPGYAVYAQSSLVVSGTLPINIGGTVPERLQELVFLLRKVYSEYDPDVLVYEEIPAQRYGGGNANGHASLLKAVGAILSISGPDHYIGMLPISWKKLVRPGYVKGDEEDAIELGYIAIQESKKILEEEGRKQNKKKKAGSYET